MDYLFPSQIRTSCSSRILINFAVQEPDFHAVQKDSLACRM